MITTYVISPLLSRGAPGPVRLPGQKAQGHGLRFASVDRISKRHGGEVWAESTLDGGATWYFTLAQP